MADKNVCPLFGSVRQEPVFENDVLDIGRAEQSGAVRQKTAKPEAAHGGG